MTGSLFRKIVSRGVGPMLLFIAGPATNATEAPAAPAAGKIADMPQQISYVGGQLTIRALNILLSDILAKVGALTGAKIELPEGVNNDLIPVIQLGPGPAREILGSLLSDSKFDYLIQESNTEPGKLQSVLILPAGKRDGSTGTDAPTPPPRGSRAHIEAPPESEEAAATPANPIPDQPTEPSAQNPPIPSTQPEQSGELNAAQSNNKSDLTRPPVLPPSDMTQQNINQQLQQMYQQRMQMIQQSRQPAAPGQQ